VRGTGRKIPEELKARAVELFKGGLSANDVALAAGVHVTNLYKWSRESAPRQAFRAVTLHAAVEDSIMAPEEVEEVEALEAPEKDQDAKGVVFHFPKGTSVVLPPKCLTPAVLEALLCVERG
jgi:transposase-like protein